MNHERRDHPDDAKNVPLEDGVHEHTLTLVSAAGTVQLDLRGLEQTGTALDARRLLELQALEDGKLVRVRLLHDVRELCDQERLNQFIILTVIFVSADDLDVADSAHLLDFLNYCRGRCSNAAMLFLAEGVVRCLTWWRHETRQAFKLLVEALIEIGEAAIPFAIKLQKHKRGIVRAYGARVIGSQGVAAVSPSVELLCSRCPYDHYCLGTALHAIGAPAALGVSALLRSPNRVARRNAARAMGRIGSAAAPYVAELVKMLRGADKNLQIMARDSLVQIGASCAPYVAELLDSLDLELRYAACTALVVLSKMSRASAVHAEKVALQLRESDARLRHVAITSLALIGAPGVVHVVELLQDSHPRVRHAAAVCLAHIGAPAAPFVAALFSDRDVSLHRRASMVIAVARDLCRNTAKALKAQELIVGTQWFKFVLAISNRAQGLQVEGLLEKKEVHSEADIGYYEEEGEEELDEFAGDVCEEEEEEVMVGTEEPVRAVSDSIIIPSNC